MHTSRDDYVINTLRFVSAREATQIYGAVLPESLTSPKMKGTKAYKTYYIFATGATPPKIARTSVREKVDVSRGKGIELLSEVALTEDTEFEEVRQKSLRDFHRTHLSGSGAATKKAPSATKVKPSVTNEGTSDKPGNEDDRNDDHDSSSEDSDQENDNDEDEPQSNNEKESDFEHETDENDTGSESDQEENEEDEKDDEENEEEEFVRTSSEHTPFDDEKDTNVESKVEEIAEEMGYTTSLLYDDVDIRQNEPVDTDEGVFQKKGTNADENPKISLVIDDAHVTLSSVPQKTEVLVTSSSHSSDLESQLLNFSDIHHTDEKIVSPLDILVHHEVPSNQLTTLFTIPVSVITESSPIYTTDITQSLPSSAPSPPQSTSTPTPTTKATNP
ncbi:hypothetical protein Tco_1459394 [Tanacetum coccineum]